MDDDAIGGSALTECHVERVDDQLGAQMIGHRPADILRLQASSTTAKYMNPADVGTNVMSPTQS